MATRFYLPASGTAAYTPSQLSGWENTTSFTSFPTDTVKSNTALGAGAARAKGSTVANDDRLDRVFVSNQQLAAQTISAGTFSAVIRAIQSAATTDAWLQVMIRVVSNDGTTQRGLIFSGSTATTEVATAGADAQEYGTTSSTRIKSAIATSSVVASAGDRLQIEIGARINGTTSADTFTHRYGDPSATGDFALTAGLTTDLCPWVELSNNLTWWAPAGSGTGSWTFAGAGVGEAPSSSPGLRANALGGDGQTSSAVTTTSIVIPANAATDGTDYAVVAFSMNSAGTTISSAPTGWTDLAGKQSTNFQASYLYGKTIAPGEPGTTVTWTWSAGTLAVGHMAVYKNVTATGMLVGTPNVDNTAGTSIDVPSLGSVPAGALVDVHFAIATDSAPPADVSTPSGYSSGASPRSAAGASGRQSSEHAYKVASTAGTYGGETASIDISARGVVYIVALPSASAKSGSGTGTWTFAGAGSGKRVAGGSGSGSWAFSGAGAGTRAPKASGTGTFTFTGAGTGSRPAGGAGTGAWTFAGTGVGSRPAKGAGSGTWTFAGTGVGERPRIGSGSGTWAWVGSGTGIQPITPSHVPGTAVLAPQTPGTATLASNGLSTAVLAGDGLSTAVITSVPATATIQST